MQIITFELAPDKTNNKCENLFYILFCILILVQQNIFFPILKINIDAAVTVERTLLT